MNNKMKSQLLLLAVLFSISQCDTSSNHRFLQKDDFLAKEIPPAASNETIVHALNETILLNKTSEPIIKLVDLKNETKKISPTVLKNTTARSK